MALDLSGQNQKQTPKATYLQHFCCIVKPATFSTSFPTFLLLSSNLPTLFACTPPSRPIVGLSMQIKRILEQPQNILLQTLEEEEAVHITVCIDWHSDSKKPKLELKSALSHLDILPKETAA